jgi:hypothetical protein
MPLPLPLLVALLLPSNGAANHDDEPDGAFLTEDGAFYLVTEDGASFLQQEAA